MDKALKGLFSGRNIGILLHTASGKNALSYLFTSPVARVECPYSGNIIRALEKIESYCKSGYYAAGYVNFEPGYFLEKKAGHPRVKPDERALCFGIYKKPKTYRGLSFEAGIEGKIKGLKPDTGFQAYKKGFNEVKKLIKSGELYQVNYCFKAGFGYEGGPGPLFSGMLKRQAVEYSAFIREKDRWVLSFSPELFFSVDKGRITMKPMKGTLLKPCGPEELRKFKSCAKTSAENIMIVDMVRNDLGRICGTRPVKVPALFEVAEYGTLYQMTSTVTGKLRRDAGLADIFRAIFPSGSVTGAPKIRAMQAITGLERTDRGIYTGAIGFITPKTKKAVFNIPIRTAVLKGGKGVMGIGSGIVYDSKAADEYRECIGKAGFLAGELQLIESLLYSSEKSFLFDSHLSRVER